MTSPEDLLAATLREHAERLDPSRTPLPDVVGTAVAIRRRRHRAVAVAVAAAVVAVAAPTAFAVGTRSGPFEPADPGPSAPSSTTPNDTSTTPWFRVQDLPDGPPPAVDYVDGDVYVSTTGARFTLREPRGIGAVTPYHGGFLIADAGTDEWTAELHQVDGQGTDTLLGCTIGSPVVSSDALTTAWVSYDCDRATGSVTRVEIHRGVSTGMGEGETTQKITGNARLVGMIGNQVVYTGMSGAGAWITDLTSPPREIPGLATVGGVDGNDGLVSGQAAGSDGSVGVVVDATSGEVRATIDGWVLGAFSPDGRYVVATQLRRSTAPVAIFDASTGEMVSEMFGGPGGAPQPGPVAWEDATHLLVVVNDYHQLAIVRADVDGTLSLATKPVPTSSTSYVFAARP